MKIQVSSLLIGVRDLNKSRSFFEDVFGMKTIEFRPPFMEGELGGVEFNIEEDAPNRSKNWAKYNIGTRKSFSFGTDDIEAFLKIVEEKGGKIIEPITKQSWGYYEAVYRIWTVMNS